MNTPICEECVKTGILCNECKEKKACGEISETEIFLAKLLTQLERRDLLRGASFERAFQVNGLMVIATRGKVGTLVGKGGRVIRLLSKEFNSKVRIINSTSVKSALTDLVAPAKVQGINIVYRPESEETKVIISNEDKDKLIASIDTLQKAASQLTDKTVIIEVR